MDHPKANLHSRRTFLHAILSYVGMLVLGKHWVRADEEDKHQAARFAFTYHRDYWRAGHLNQFLELLDPKDLLALKQS